MARPWSRPLITAAAAGMLLLGIISIVAGSSGGTAQAAGEYTIDILASGFNPEVCVVNRNSSRIVWLNKDTVPHRVFFPGEFPGQPLYDSGDIPPGGTSQGGVVVNQNTTLTYSDPGFPKLKGTIIAPIDNNATSNCSPLPPTPTPTPTRTPTPIPTATPIAATPTPLVLPPRCIGLVGCAVAPAVARDREE
ncbi:MAG: hypothetical protein HYX53_00935 [Chloroflexi bacterium]|nr:hypothetical protein [Chloroflexota bacterium]